MFTFEVYRGTYLWEHINAITDWRKGRRVAKTVDPEEAPAGTAAGAATGGAGLTPTASRGSSGSDASGASSGTNAQELAETLVEFIKPAKGAAPAATAARDLSNAGPEEESDTRRVSLRAHLRTLLENTESARCAALFVWKQQFVHADDFASAMVFLWLLLDVFVGRVVISQDAHNVGPIIFTTANGQEGMTILAYCVFLVVERFATKVGAVMNRQALFIAYRRRCTDIVLSHAATRDRALEAMSNRRKRWSYHELGSTGADGSGKSSWFDWSPKRLVFSGLDAEIAKVIEHLETCHYQFFDFLFSVAVLGAVCTFFFMHYNIETL